ncbi:hypothetical protein AVEN_9001-1 [Araneus ventricosus]|uniref:Uncharacterized protein n=1 Tax=Araneus ventricosus TaxID=182803 RepID=A0A4Y2DR38_ARAVE|nr:hypothetical protein AVEN_9001-1 [Araneus ventricosus]
MKKVHYKRVRAFSFPKKSLGDDAWSVTGSRKIHGRQSLHYLPVTAINKTLASGLFRSRPSVTFRPTLIRQNKLFAALRSESSWVRSFKTVMRSYLERVSDFPPSLTIFTQIWRTLLLNKA